jgi:hypothetical protein
VPDVRRNLALLSGAAAGTVAAVLLRRRAKLPRPPAEPGEAVDPRAEELRRKLAEARESAADEEEFEAAGMGPETLVEDDADVAEMRRRVHEEARATAEEMRRSAEEAEPARPDERP